MSFFILAYDNSEDLIHIEEEAHEIYKETCRAASNRNFLPINLPKASISNVNDFLVSYGNETSVFLFSGHAHGDRLKFEREIANAAGIAMHLTRSAQNGILKVVILNGCATKEAVRIFFQTGVPVVIATNARVEDRRASEFGKAFFKSACERGTNIRDSFYAGLAAAKLMDVNNEIKEGNNLRRLDILDEIPDDQPLWELFYRDDPEQAEQYIIPNVDPKKFKFRYNEKLLKSILTSFCNAGNQYIESIWLKDQIANQGQVLTRVVPKSQKENAICHVLPMPIGARLHLLLNLNVNASANSDPHLPFKRLSELFQSTVEFLTIVMVAQLWEVELKCRYVRMDPFKNFEAQEGFEPPVFQDNILSLSPELRIKLKEFFETVSSKRSALHFEDLFFLIRNFLSQHHHAEDALKIIGRQVILRDFMAINQEDFVLACKNYRKAEANYSVGPSPQFFDDGEIALCELFNPLGFLHRYILSSIQSVEAYRKRHEKWKTTYTHKAVQLDYEKPRDGDDINIQTVTDSKNLDCPGMIISVQDQTSSKTLDSLNLSPFILDINAFETVKDRARPLIFNGPAARGYYYRESEDPLSMNQEIVADGKLNQVIEELKAFRQFIDYAK